MATTRIDAPGPELRRLRWQWLGAVAFTFFAIKGCGWLLFTLFVAHWLS